MNPAQTAELARILDRARASGLTDVDSRIETEGPERILIVSGKRNGEPVEMSFAITTGASIDRALRLLGTATDGLDPKPGGRR